MNTSNLKTLRKTAKLTQEELAEKLNVTRQTVAKWETGESLPDIDSCIRMATLYNITLDDLVMYAKQPHSNQSPKGKHIFGVVKIRPDNTIKLPDKAMEVFDLEKGDKVLILGDEAQGIAVVKLKGFIDFTNEFLKALKNSEDEDKDKEEG
ncbi:MAG: helix-turn-helix transcriptional regulator [Huintestinicola sp.]